MNTKSELGKLGEDMAYKYLINKGYEVVERNYRQPWGEIDIIGRSPDNVLVFFEVKTVKPRDVDNLLITPEDKMTQAKLRNVKRTASLYAGEFNSRIEDEAGWRIDLMVTIP